MYISEELFRLAVEETLKGHSKQKAVIDFKKDYEANVREMYASLQDGTWRRYIAYRELDKTNNNGKHRHIFEPALRLRMLEHTWLLLVVPLYNEANRGIDMARNCIPDHGITAKRKEDGVLQEVKHLFYDLRQYHCVLVMDQRQCYHHVRISVYRKAMKFLFHRLGLPVDTELIDFGEAVSFPPDGELPIGTPTSPWIHHIIMLQSDIFIRENIEWALRYADDNIMAFRDAHELNAMKWRIQNLWWYVYGIRAKRWATKIVDIDKSGLDFCAYIPHRNASRSVTSHDKGYTVVRLQTVRRAKGCKEKSFPSYFGILKEADCFAILEKIQKRMKACDLVQKIRIDREMDAKNITTRELAENHIVHTVYDYKMLNGKDGKPNWIKCVIGFPEVDKNTGELTGREEAREYHGSLQGIIRWFCELEKAFPGRAFMPIEDGVIVNECGYIYKGSTNRINYIDSTNYGR